VDQDPGIDDGTRGSRAKAIANYSELQCFHGCEQGVDGLSVSGASLFLNENIPLTSKNVDVTGMNLVEPEAETADTSMAWRLSSS
jgi:hypothetical protein